MPQKFLSLCGQYVDLMCTKVGNYLQITDKKLQLFIIILIFNNLAMHFVTCDFYDASQGLAMKHFRDDFIRIQPRKKSDHNRKTFSSHSRHNPLFFIKFQLHFWI